MSATTPNVSGRAKLRKDGVLCLVFCLVVDPVDKVDSGSLYTTLDGDEPCVRLVTMIGGIVCEQPQCRWPMDASEIGLIVVGGWVDRR